MGGGLEGKASCQGNQLGTIETIHDRAPKGQNGGLWQCGCKRRDRFEKHHREVSWAWFGDWMVASKWGRSPGDFHDSCLSYRVDDSTLTKKKNPREGEGFQENDEELWLLVLSLKDSCDFLGEVSNNTSQVLSRSVIPFAIPIPPPSLWVAVLCHTALILIFLNGPGCKNGQLSCASGHLPGPSVSLAFYFAFLKASTGDLEFSSPFDPKRSY